MKSAREMKSTIIDHRLVKAHPEDMENNVFQSDTVTAVAPNAFEDCKESLTEVILPNAEEIDESAFANCVGMKTCIIPRGTMEGSRILTDCPSLETWVLHCSSELYEIPRYVLCSPTSLKSLIFFGEATTEDKEGLCRALIQLHTVQIRFIPESQEEFMMSNLHGVLQTKAESIIEDGVLLRAGDADVINDVFQNEQVTSVASCVFYEHRIKEVILPNATVLGPLAFMKCTIEKFIAPKLKTAQYGAFDSATKLQLIDLSNVTTIEHNLFANCKKLTRCNLSGVTKLQYGAVSKCQSLETLILHRSIELDTSALVPELPASLQSIILVDGSTEDKARLQSQLPENLKNINIECLPHWQKLIPLVLIKTAMTKLSNTDLCQHIFSFYNQLGAITYEQAKKRLEPKPALPPRQRLLKPVVESQSVSDVENTTSSTPPIPTTKKTARPPAEVPVKLPKKPGINKGWQLINEVPSENKKKSASEQGLFKPDQETRRANNARIIIKQVREGITKYLSDDANSNDTMCSQSLQNVLESKINPHWKIIAIVAVLDDSKTADKLAACIKTRLGNTNLRYLEKKLFAFAQQTLSITDPNALEAAKRYILVKLNDGTYSKPNIIEDKDVFSSDFQNNASMMQG